MADGYGGAGATVADDEALGFEPDQPVASQSPRAAQGSSTSPKPADDDLGFVPDKTTPPQPRAAQPARGASDDDLGFVADAQKAPPMSVRPYGHAVDDKGQLHTIRADKSDQEIYNESQADRAAAQPSGLPGAGRELTTGVRQAAAAAKPAIAQYPENQPAPDPAYVGRKATWESLMRQGEPAAAGTFEEDPEQERRIKAQEEAHASESAIPQAAIPALAAGKKVLVDPFERAAQAGAKAGGEMAEGGAAAITGGPGGFAQPGEAVDPESGLPLPRPQEYSPEVLQKLRKEHPAVAGSVRAAGEVVGGMAADPRMWPFFFAGPEVSPALRAATGAGFAGQMGAGAVESASHLADVMKRDDIPADQKWELGANAVISTIMAVSGGKHLGRGEIESTLRDFSQLPAEDQEQIRQRIRQKAPQLADEVDKARTVQTFLPSTKTPARGRTAQPTPPAPVASPAVTAATSTMAKADQVREMAARVARGMPPVEPQPQQPTLGQQFGNRLSGQQVEHLTRHIADASDDQRDALVDELHQSLTQWISDKNGRVVIDGHLHLAKNPQQAETLAQKLVNGAVQMHDKMRTTPAVPPETQRELENLRPTPGARRGRFSEGDEVPAMVSPRMIADYESEGFTITPEGRLARKPAPAAPPVTTEHPELAAQADAARANPDVQRFLDQSRPETMGAGITQDSPAVRAVAEQADVAPGQVPEIGVKKESSADAARLAQPARPVSNAQLERVGTVDKETGRVILQPSTSELQNERLAAEAAPELTTKLSHMAASVPGAEFVRLRPQKNLERIGQKTEDDKPAETLSDYIAGQITADTPEAKDRLIAELRRSFPVIDVEDKFLTGRPDKAGYASANVQVQLPSGLSAEIQIIPREVNDVYEHSHHFYTEGRKAEQRGDTAARDRHYARAASITGAALDRFKERNGIETGAQHEMVASDTVGKLREAIKHLPNGLTNPFTHEKINLAVENPSDADLRWYAQVIIDNYLDGELQGFPKDVVDAVIGSIKPENLERLREAKASTQHIDFGGLTGTEAPPARQRVGRIEREIDDIAERARERQESASDAMRGLRPAAIDWMTQEETKRLHELQQELGSLTREERSPAAARERVAARRAARLPAGRTLEGKIGAKTNLKTAAGESLPGRYKLVEADDLVTSHHPVRFTSDARYPQGVQERNYDRDKNAQALLIQQEQMFDPDYHINTNPDAVNGPPVVTPSGVVLGGNSRTMAIQRVYHHGNEQNYIDLLKDRASHFGLSADDVDRFTRPVLVREIPEPKSTEEARRLGTDLNKSRTKALTPSERAVSVGKSVSEDTLRSIADMGVSIGQHATLREIMKDNGPEIMRRVVADGAITEREKPTFMDTQTGGMSEEGKTLVERMLRGRVVQDPQVLDRIPKSTFAKLDTSLADLAYLDSRDDAYNILPQLKQALEAHAEMAAQGLTVDDYLNQGGFFKPDQSAPVAALIKKLAEKPQAVRRAVHQFAQDAAIDKPGQGFLLAENQPDPHEAFNAAFGSHVTAAELKERAEAAAPRPKHDFGSTQINIAPGSELGRAHAAAVAAIPEKHIGKEGREATPHVTIRYGLKDDSPEAIEKVRAAVAGVRPFEVPVGKTDIFPATEHSSFDHPVIARLETTPELKALRDAVESAGGFKEDNFPEYKPHVTLAYVKPEFAKQYRGGSQLEGQTVPVREIAVSKRDGSQEVIPLGERRTNAATRKRVAEMSPEERSRALLTSDKTGLPNYRAFQESERDLADSHPHIGYADLDDFKSFNAKLGHAAVDEIVLPGVGKLFRDAAAREDVHAFHRSGDEFLFRATDPDSITRVVGAVNRELAETIFKYETPDGTILEQKGTGLSHGTGRDEVTAEQAAGDDKQQRKEAGLRSGARDLPTVDQERAGRQQTPQYAASGRGNLQEKTAEASRVTPTSKPALSDLEPGIGPGELSKGDRVTLVDGRRGMVQYAHPEMGLARVKFDDGKTETVGLKSIRDNKSRAGEAGFARMDFVTAPVTAPIQALKAVNRFYDQRVAKLIERTGMGRAHADIEKHDPALATAMRVRDNAPAYFRVKAESIINRVLEPLGGSRAKEKGFVLLADQQSRDWLQANRPDEYERYSSDPDIRKALDIYKPYEEDLREARRSLGGQVIEQDYLRRVYDQHTSGIGQEFTKTQGKHGPAFDRVITPQMADRNTRTADPAYYYAHGLHEFGPSFGTRYVGTMLKVAEHKAAMEAISMSTLVEPGDDLPHMIEYNGQEYYRHDIARLIRDSQPGSAGSAALAKALGIDELPKPKDVQEYAEYRPFSNLVAAARIAKEMGAGSSPEAVWQTKYLMPKEIAEALNKDEGVKEATVNPLRSALRAVKGYTQKQIVGFGYGIPHMGNILRRVMQSAPMGVADPRGWVAAVKVAFSKDLKRRGISGIDDPTFDMLLQHGGISKDGVDRFKQYVEANLDPRTWANALREGGRAEAPITVKSVGQAPIRAAGQVMETIAHAGHKNLFKPGGIDQRARLYIADLLKSQRPDLTHEQISQAVNEQLGRYNKGTWTKLQRDIADFMLFPGWDFSSVNWILRHPIRTTLPPALLIVIANNVLFTLGQNREKDRWDPVRFHLGGRSWKTNLLSEHMAESLWGPALRYGMARAAGKGNKTAVGEAASGIPSDVAGLGTRALNPLLSAPLDLSFNRLFPGSGQEIVPRADAGKPGTVFPSKAADDLAAYGITQAVPAVRRLTDLQSGKVDELGAAGSLVGVSTHKDEKKKKKR